MSPWTATRTALHRLRRAWLGLQIVELMRLSAWAEWRAERLVERLRRLGGRP